MVAMVAKIKHADINKDVHPMFPITDSWAGKPRYTQDPAQCWNGPGR